MTRENGDMNKDELPIIAMGGFTITRRLEGSTDNPKIVRARDQMCPRKQFSREGVNDTGGQVTEGNRYIQQSELPVDCGRRVHTDQWVHWTAIGRQTV